MGHDGRGRMGRLPLELNGGREKPLLGEHEKTSDFKALHE
jgi:hypothetical protein